MGWIPQAKRVFEVQSSEGRLPWDYLGPDVRDMARG